MKEILTTTSVSMFTSVCGDEETSVAGPHIWRHKVFTTGYRFYVIFVSYNLKTLLSLHVSNF
jgi:hypothetical protein